VILARAEVGGDAHVLVVGLDGLLEQRRGLGLSAEPTHALTGCVRWRVRRVVRGPHPVRTPRDPSPSRSSASACAENGGFRDRVDEANTEDRWRQPQGYRHARRRALGLGARDRAVLDLRPTDGAKHVVVARADSLQGVRESAAAIGAVAGCARDVVEDRPEACGRRESSLELGVAPDEGGELVGGQSGKCSIERVAVGRGFRGEITAADNAREARGSRSEESAEGLVWLAFAGVHEGRHRRVSLQRHNT
jgi:hypothetical protein